MKKLNNTMELIKYVETDIYAICIDVESEKLDGSKARKTALIEWAKQAIDAQFNGETIPDYSHIGKRFTKSQDAFINSIVCDTLIIEDTIRKYANATDIGYHAFKVFADFWNNCQHTDAKYDIYYGLINAANSGKIGLDISNAVMEAFVPYYSNASVYVHKMVEAIQSALCEMEAKEHVEPSQQPGMVVEGGTALLQSDRLTRSEILRNMAARGLGFMLGAIDDSRMLPTDCKAICELVESASIIYNETFEDGGAAIMRAFASMLRSLREGGLYNLSDYARCIAIQCLEMVYDTGYEITLLQRNNVPDEVHEYLYYSAQTATVKAVEAVETNGYKSELVGYYVADIWKKIAVHSGQIESIANNYWYMLGGITSTCESDECKLAFNGLVAAWEYCYSPDNLDDGGVPPSQPAYAVNEYSDAVSADHEGGDAITYEELMLSLIAKEYLFVDESLNMGGTDEQQAFIEITWETIVNTFTTCRKCNISTLPGLIEGIKNAIVTAETVYDRTAMQCFGLAVTGVYKLAECAAAGRIGKVSLGIIKAAERAQDAVFDMLLARFKQSAIISDIWNMIYYGRNSINFYEMQIAVQLGDKKPRGWNRFDKAYRQLKNLISNDEWEFPDNDSTPPDDGGGNPSKDDTEKGKTLPALTVPYTNDSLVPLYQELLLCLFYSSYANIVQAMRTATDEDITLMKHLWWCMCDIFNTSLLIEGHMEPDKWGNEWLSQVDLYIHDDTARRYMRETVLDFITYAGWFEHGVIGVIPSNVLEAAQAVTDDFSALYFGETGAAVIRRVWECVAMRGACVQEISQQIKNLLEPFQNYDHSAIMERLYYFYKVVSAVGDDNLTPQGEGG